MIQAIVSAEASATVVVVMDRLRKLHKGKSVFMYLCFGLASFCGLQWLMYILVVISVIVRGVLEVLFVDEVSENVLTFNALVL